MTEKTMTATATPERRHRRTRDGDAGSTPRTTGPARRLRLALAALAGAFLGPVLAAEPDTARSRPSDDGAFVVAIESQVEPVPLNAMHAWVVHVETADGEPVEGATFAIDGGMPMHDHGLPTAPRVTEELGGGDYLLEGVKFQMPGHWVVSFAISGAGTEDSVTFELML